MNNNLSILSTTFLEELYAKYLCDPSSVDSSWQGYFKSLNNGYQVTTNKCEVNTNLNTSNLLGYNLLSHYRQYGHVTAELDYLSDQKPEFKYKLNTSNLLDTVDISEKSNFCEMTLGDLEAVLKRTYSSTIGFEFEHLDNPEEKEWLYHKVEENAWKVDALFDNDDREWFLQILMRTKLFENYLHTKFLGAKRFSVEGGEAAILALQEIVRLCASNGTDEMMIGMAHRGRLSTLVQVLHKPHSSLFAGFMGYALGSELPSFVGDVKYHLGYDHDIEIDGKKVHISLAYNPSHLESINSILMGAAKAKQDLKQDQDKVIPILIHGDASFAGQGIVMESLAMTKLNAYDVGGVFHLVINNQIGFTTDPAQDRSTRYCSDVAKGFDIPVIHVNGNDPEAVVYAVRLAFEYKNHFKKDIVIDLVCHRKYGHNEGDEPMFTQPIMYSKIHSKEFKDGVDLYAEKVQKLNSEMKPDSIAKDYLNFMDSEFELAKKIVAGEMPYENHASDEVLDKHIAIEKKIYALHTGTDDIGISKLGDTDITQIQTANTGVPLDTLRALGLKLSTAPKDFNLNSKIGRQFEARKKMMESGEGLDWGTGESLAFASILSDGFNIRFTGEDVERGTFSHRHAVLTDQVNCIKYINLNNLDPQQKGKIFIENSFLSEFGVLGYEYGYAMANPKNLTIWEAQFGDFANGAQIVIDQYIASAESKWGIINNLVMLLPHGYEGQGPEHSSARLERFLQLCAQNNMQVCNCTTPASLFHVLRRQVMQDSKKPLIIMSPKSLLRHKMAVSSLNEMSESTSFKPVITESNLQGAKKIIFCSGKVYYDLVEQRETKNSAEVSIVRLEQLYPFPAAEVSKIVSGGAEIVWCQEEPENMGAFSFVKPIFEKLGVKDLKYAGRQRSASPAVGFASLHQSELEKLLNNAI